LVVLLGVFSASQAVDLDSLKDVGSQLVGQLVEKGKELVSQFAQDLLGKLVGKRDLSLVSDVLKGLGQRFGSLLDAGKEAASQTFRTAVDKLKELADKFHKAIGTVQDASVIAKEIDEIVEEHDAQQKRFIADLFQSGKQLLSNLVDGAKGALAQLKEKASEVVSNLLQKGVDVVGKRAIVEHLQNLGKVLGDAVSPFKDVVANLGNTLKGHFSNLVDTVKGHVNSLKDKLTPHVEDLKGHGTKLLEHGKNALSALSEVVKDVANQTLNNLKPTLDGVSKTVQDAGKTVVDHLAGSKSSN